MQQPNDNARMINELRLVGQLIVKDILRYTPAGLPVVTAQVLHESQQQEAHNQRVIRFEMPVITIGNLSNLLNQTEVGTMLECFGFLAPKKQGAKSLVLHLTQLNVYSIKDK